jgi:hypothetical protein
MLIVSDSTDLFNPVEKEILESKCTSFANNDVPNLKSTNYYVREFIPRDNMEFQTIISKINDRVSSLLKTDNIVLNAFWINKVTNETNKNDGFHTDESDITFLMYLNDNFIGGDYEYAIPETRKKERLKPKKYLSIITDINVRHRVIPVIEGERYSIVFFYSVNKKSSKTLI